MSILRKYLYDFISTKFDAKWKIGRCVWLTCSILMGAHLFGQYFPNHELLTLSLTSNPPPTDRPFRHKYGERISSAVFEPKPCLVSWPNNFAKSISIKQAVFKWKEKKKSCVRKGWGWFCKGCGVPGYVCVSGMIFQLCHHNPACNARVFERMKRKGDMPEKWKIPIRFSTTQIPGECLRMWSEPIYISSRFSSLEIHRTCR